MAIPDTWNVHAKRYGTRYKRATLKSHTHQCKKENGEARVTQTTVGSRIQGKGNRTRGESQRSGGDEIDKETENFERIGQNKESRAEEPTEEP